MAAASSTGRQFMIYWVDETFEGVLTAVFEAFRLHETPQILSLSHGMQLTMDGEARHIRTDPDKADRVWKGIERKMSGHALQVFYAAWLGESEEVPGLVLHAVQRGMELGEGVFGQLQDPGMHRLNALYRKVMHEVHFFTGTLRFVRSPTGVYHASYEPDANITELLAPHFAERLSDQPFLIHDLRRGRCAIYDGRSITLAWAPKELRPPDKDMDADFEALWRRYFTTIAVEGRRNDKLQRAFLPRRYWRHLTEMEGRS